jgi:hypothetical protein
MHELIRLSRVVVLSLVAICAPCLRAQDQEPPDPLLPPPIMPLWVLADAWGFDDYAYRVNLNFIEGKTMVHVFGGQPPYEITFGDCPLYRSPSDGRPNGWTSFYYNPTSSLLWPFNVACYAGILADETLPWVVRGVGRYSGECMVFVTDAVGNYAEASFPVHVNLY